MRPNTPAARPLRVLVTGAAGLVGRAVCATLAARGHAVTGLCRRGGGVAPSVTTVTGDVAEPGLGLLPDAAAALAAALDLVVHCAAVTDFNLPTATYARVNTGGTAQVLSFAGGPRPVPVLHVSTAYVCGLADGAVPEAPARPARFNNGYEASKAAAEALALALAAVDAGRTVVVARPSVVVGRWADGGTDAFGAIYHLLRLATDGRITALPVAAGASLDLVPIDHVAAGLADIAERMGEANGRIFHLASGHPVPLTALLDLLPHFPTLRPPRLVDPAAVALAALDGRERSLHAHVVPAFAPYLRPSPRFATGNLAALSGRRCPVPDAAFLLRLVGFAVAAGFLAGERVGGYPEPVGRAVAAVPEPG